MTTYKCNSLKKFNCFQLGSCELENLLWLLVQRIFKNFKTW